MSLSKIVSAESSPAQTLVLANRTLINQPLKEIIEGLFEAQPVAVRVEDLPDQPSDRLVLRRDGETVAMSSVNDLLDSLLLVESGDFVTGRIPLSAVDLPDVVTALEETTFRVDGNANAGREKLLFIAISRFVEKLAVEGDGGTLRAGFQELSRMRRERGTEAVYRTLGQTDVDVHVYGLPDWIPPESFGATIHGGYSEAFTDHWFVVYDAPDGDETESMAFVSTSLGGDRWEGFWSTDEELVAEISDHIAKTM